MPGKRAPLTVLILAAGQGTRLKSKTIKLLHPVAGQPMATWVARAAAGLKPDKTVAVVGFQSEQVEAALGDLCDAFVLQREQRGTGHAVLQAASALKGAGGPLLIVNGDLPSLRAETLAALIALHRKEKAALSLVTTVLPDATGYGRIVRDGGGRVERIVEHKDATASERALREINCGIYCADPTLLFPLLRKLRPDNAQGEYYLTDAVHALIKKKAKVVALVHGASDEVLGVNTRAELARAGAELYARKATALQEGGVTLLDPSRTWVDPRASIARDVVLYPDVIVEGETTIGEDSVVRPGCRLNGVRLGRGVEIKDHSVLEDAVVGDFASVGPFAHLRPGSVLERDAKVGNFVELKKTTLGRGSKASHLAYLGDAQIGHDCNIGAGTITCNYDGVHKHKTTLGAGVFIGSDTQLVAPVSVGEGAYVGAGTTVTDDVPAGALALSRVRQLNLEGWVARKKKKAAAGSSHHS
ncbi:MAG TPA: bifunctional UDP-N-acetylglucosamine diphosphorylase/glucosamine-1-phosphate N-acetyltransferase GlmU [Candidatus Polarisedimenticolaceae bacterium]|nr:bifunctional UDP-N-acetylglucosamine diphosphorylase/glucosamine-1-phosphate N-acetyltransferase GlmU [Candidatus Polarisedimenticolaceae bacterium]